MNIIPLDYPINKSINFSSNYRYNGCVAYKCEVDKELDRTLGITIFTKMRWAIGKKLSQLLKKLNSSKNRG